MSEVETVEVNRKGRRVLYLTLPQAIRLVNYAKIWFDELRERERRGRRPRTSHRQAGGEENGV